MTVLSGEIECARRRSHTQLHSGDVLICEADIEHAIANRGTKEASLHMVVRISSTRRRTNGRGA